MKLDYKKTFFIGLGFFTVSLVWGIYNVKTPLYLKELGLSGVAVGSVMTIDNIFAIIFLPIFGALSDRTKTRYGRRMPYLLVGIPLSAAAFFLIPFAQSSLLFLMITIIAMNFFMSIYRAPTVALMPDVTPRPLRSKANGIINFMGGAGSVVTFVAAGFLLKVNEIYPFAAVSIIMILVIILMYNMVREPEELEDEKTVNEAAGSPEGERGKTMSLIFLLLAIFFWFTGYNAVETFFSTYGAEVLKISDSQTAFLLAVFSGLFLVFAIPSGIIATRMGRKKVILSGIVLLTAVFVSLIFVKSILPMYALLAVGGISWALININSYPMVVEMTANKGIGQYTGYYYFFSMLAAIVSPILFGFLKDMLGDDFLFIYASIAMVIAFSFMMPVKHGEAKAGSKSAFEGIEHMEA